MQNYKRRKLYLEKIPESDIKLININEVKAKMPIFPFFNGKTIGKFLYRTKVQEAELKMNIPSLLYNKL